MRATRFGAREPWLMGWIAHFRRATLYGINTGFGALSEVHISASDIRTLQRNLLRSHACGVGPDSPRPRCAR